MVRDIHLYGCQGHLLHHTHCMPVDSAGQFRLLKKMIMCRVAPSHECPAAGAHPSRPRRSQQACLGVPGPAAASSTACAAARTRATPPAAAPLMVPGSVPEPQQDSRHGKRLREAPSDHNGPQAKRGRLLSTTPPPDTAAAGFTRSDAAAGRVPQLQPAAGDVRCQGLSRGWLAARRPGEPAKHQMQASCLMAPAWLSRRSLSGLHCYATCQLLWSCKKFWQLHHGIHKNKEREAGHFAATNLNLHASGRVCALCLGR